MIAFLILLAAAYGVGVVISYVNSDPASGNGLTHALKWPVRVGPQLADEFGGFPEDWGKDDEETAAGTAPAKPETGNPAPGDNIAVAAKEQADAAVAAAVAAAGKSTASSEPSSDGAPSSDKPASN